MASVWPGIVPEAHGLPDRYSPSRRQSGPQCTAETLQNHAPDPVATAAVMKTQARSFFAQASDVLIVPVCKGALVGQQLLSTQDESTFKLLLRI